MEPYPRSVFFWILLRGLAWKSSGEGTESAFFIAVMGVRLPKADVIDVDQVLYDFPPGSLDKLYALRHIFLQP